MISSYNIIHGSDSKEAAQNEIELWFQKNEIV
jgi:nucleoside diphosphate kinase